jgi:glycosyltransferase involved in cell wall biosynthesis
MLSSSEIFSTKVKYGIVVPAYGNPVYLRDTLDSIIRTQDISVRILVVDDGSRTKYIRKLVREFYPRVHFMRNEVNLGIASNFNFCLRVINASFVMVVGHDDILVDNLPTIFSDDISSDVDILITNVKVINGDGVKQFFLADLVKQILSPKDFGRLSTKSVHFRLITGNWIYFPGLVWNVSKLPEIPFNPEFDVCMDWDLLLRLSAQGAIFYKSPKEILHYRRHIDSESMKNHRKRFEEEIKIHKEIPTYSSSKSIKIKLFSSMALIPRLNLFLMILRLSLSGYFR